MENVFIWKQQTENSNSIQYLLTAQSLAETQADDFVSQLKQTIIPACVQRCVDEGRSDFGIPCTSWYLNTDAFVGFRSWLASQGLMCVCSQAAERSQDDPDADVVLHFLPLV